MSVRVRSVRWRCVCALAALAASMCGVVRDRTASVHVPAEPHKLAHMLADFSRYPQLYPHIGSWTVESESSAMSAWRYSVSYECGARCSGVVEVLAEQPAEQPAEQLAEQPAEQLAGQPAESRASDHRVLAQHHHCSTLPLIPWTSCNWLENDTHMKKEGSGTRLVLSTRVSCSVLALVLGSCTRHLQAESDRLLASLQDITQ